MAKAERARRAAKARRARERRFAPLPGEPLAAGLRRMALGQLDLAIELLGGGGATLGAPTMRAIHGPHRARTAHGPPTARAIHGPSRVWATHDPPGAHSSHDSPPGAHPSHGPHRVRATHGPPDARTIHEARKALKRLRALLRLLRDALGERVCAREDALLRDAGGSLAGARDAEVLVSTLDALLDHRSLAKPARRRTVAELRERLVAEREAAARRVLGDGTTRGEALCELADLRERVARWSLPERPGIAVVEADLRRVYRQGRRRHRRAGRSVTGGRGKGGRGKSDARELHRWRKRVKDLRYAAELLGLPGPLARRAAALGELLGEEHDLALLAARVATPGAPFAGKAGKQARKALLKQIARRRRRLRERALREGERLYRRRPKRFARRARRAHARVWDETPAVHALARAK